MRTASFNKVNNSMNVMTRGEKIDAFIEAFCKIPEGAQVGQPIKLMKFQKQFILDVNDNPHTTTSLLLCVAIKNGKSVLIAAGFTIVLNRALI